MRKIAVCLAAGLTMAIAGCTTTASDGSLVAAASTKTFTLTDGTYQAAFPNTRSQCGVMVISGGGRSIDYTAGQCGLAPTFQSAASFNGSRIRIRQAPLTLADVTSNSISGRWRLGHYTADVTFRKQ